MAIITRSLEIVSAGSLEIPSSAEPDSAVAEATEDFLTLWRGVLDDPLALRIESRFRTRGSVICSWAEPDLKLRASHARPIDSDELPTSEYLQAGYEEPDGTGMILSVETRVLGYWNPQSDPAAGIIMDCFRDHLTRRGELSAPNHTPAISL